MFDYHEFKKKRENAKVNGMRWRATADEIAFFYLNGRERDFNHVSLADQEAKGLVAIGASFYNANFSGANLANADFMNARLFGSLFTDANLKDAYLVGADLTRVDFTDANLRNAVLTDAHFSDMKFDRANVLGMIGLYQASVMTSQVKHSFYGGIIKNENGLRLFINSNVGGSSVDFAQEKIDDYLDGTFSNRTTRDRCRLAISTIELAFLEDMENGQWDYLR